jgi:hypothetical protein
VSLRRILFIALVFCVGGCVPLSLSAQRASSLDPDDPKVEVFGGYSGFRLGGKLNDIAVPDFTRGYSGEILFNVAREYAFEISASTSSNGPSSSTQAMFGARFQRRLWRISPFVEGLIGIEHIAPKGLSSQTGPLFAGGAGLELKINRRFVVRPIQVDYAETFLRSYSVSTTASQQTSFGGARVQSGIVYSFVPYHEVLVGALCNVDPAEVDAGIPVTLRVVAKDFPRKAKLAYKYWSNGGGISGKQETALVDTSGTAAGTYKVSATVAQNRSRMAEKLSGKRHHLPTANCEAEFAVKATPPPTQLARTERPEKPEGSSSPAEKAAPMQAEAGVDAKPSTQPSAPLSAQPGAGTPERSSSPAEKAAPMQAEAGVDAKPSTQHSAPFGGKARATRFGEITFRRDVRRPTRVDNQAKAELDRYADALTAAADANGAIEGFATTKEKQNHKAVRTFAALRAVNTRSYLSKEKGLDAKRIQTYTGKGVGQKAELWIVPAGVALPKSGARAVDERKVKAVPRVPLNPRVHRNANEHKPMAQQKPETRHPPAKKQHLEQNKEQN